MLLQPPKLVPLYLVPDTVGQLRVSLEDAAGQPYDLTAARLWFAVARKETPRTALLAKSWGVAGGPSLVLEDDGHTAVVTVPAADTSAWPVEAEYLYGLRVEIPGTLDRCLVQRGPLHFLPVP